LELTRRLDWKLTPDRHTSGLTTRLASN